MRTPAPEPNHDPRPDRRRRGTTLGVTAGVIAGGLVGLAMTVPTFTNAAGQDTDPVVVEQADDTTDDTTDETTGDGPEAGVRSGERIRSALQPLVDDATLTADQADAVAEHLAGQLPGPGEHRPGRGHRPGLDGEVVADLLGIEVSELRDARRDGQSIADLAEDLGVDVQTVIDALVAEAEGHLELAVEDGRLTEEEAAAKLADLTERITARVNGERPTG
ncbi:MAG: hypothetical protein ACLGHQ_03530 [Acidimicrobiia bacterium]